MVSFFRALRNWIRFWSAFDGTFAPPSQPPVQPDALSVLTSGSLIGSLDAQYVPQTEPAAVWEPRQLRKPSASRFTITRVSGSQETVMFDGNDEDKADLVLNRERNRAGFSGSLSVDGEIVDKWGQ